MQELASLFVGWVTSA